VIVAGFVADHDDVGPLSRRGETDRGTRAKPPTLRAGSGHSVVRCVPESAGFLWARKAGASSSGIPTENATLLPTTVRLF
jgi:hypothetical protein